MMLRCIVIVLDKYHAMWAMHTNPEASNARGGTINLVGLVTLVCVMLDVKMRMHGVTILRKPIYY